MQENREEKNRVQFCRRKNCCPEVVFNDTEVTLGGAQEGFTKWTPEQFSDFVTAAKQGQFDTFLK